MSTRVLLHVGTPKTGTSHLQATLFANQPRLLEHGILYPATRHDEHFLAALDLMSLPWGGLEAEAIGAWQTLAERARLHPGTTIISHEILARATATQARRALESLGHGSGTEVHLILSARDLVRQVPAEWQENVKHRSTLTYADFLAALRAPRPQGRVAPWFWAVQELPDILERWGADLPADRVHVVTVPPPGTDPEELWRRFERAFGLDGLDLDRSYDRSNPSLGVPETALIRRINEAVNAEVAPADYRPLVREVLAHQTLSRRRTSARLGLPPEAHAWASERAAAWVAELRRREYDVIGDLDDLLGPPPRSRWVDPDAPADEDVVEAALAAVKGLLLHHVEQRRELERLRAELAETQEALRRSYLRPSYRLRERLVAGLESNPVGQGALSGYRRLRGRSSRSA